MLKLFTVIALLFATVLISAALGLLFMVRFQLSVNAAVLISGVIWFVGAGSVIAGSLEEAGRFITEHFNLPHVGRYFMLASYNFLRLPVLNGDSQKAECATELARFFVMQGRDSEARLWADTAAKHICEESKDRFRTLSRQSWVYFRLGEFDKSEKCLRRVVSKFSKERSNHNPFADEDLCWQAINYDLLAKLELRNKQPEVAEKFFRRSAQLRVEVKSLSGSASAYAENFVGTLLLEDAKDASDAEIRIREAARLLPDDLAPEHNREVAFDVLHNLERFESEEAKTTFNRLSSRCKSYGQS